MKNKNEYCLRMKEYNVNDDCVNVTIPFYESMTILDNNQILFHYVKNSNNNINKYLTDERKGNFPYSNIPMYLGSTKGYIFTYVNQIFEYNKPYITIKDGKLIENFVLKDGKSALLIHKNLEEQQKKEYEMTRQEFNEFLIENNNQTIICDENGRINKNIDVLNPSNVQIKQIIINEIEKNLNQENYNYKYLNNLGLNDNGCNMMIKGSCLLDYLKSVELEKLCKVAFELNGYIIKINNCFERFYIIKQDISDIDIKLVEVAYSDKDKLRVYISNVKVNTYTEENIKDLKLTNQKNPKIKVSINPNINMNDVLTAKKLVKNYK